MYGKARPENFPNENDYRNPTIAEAMKTLGYVNRFNRGISRVQEELKDNGNPRALFKFHHPGAFAVVVTDAVYHVYNQINAIEGKEEDLKTSNRKKVGIPKETSRETSREKIFRLIEADATLTALSMATLIGITEKGIQYHLDNLKKEGILKHTGPTKSGKWVLLKKKNDEQQTH